MEIKDILQVKKPTKHNFQWQILYIENPKWATIKILRILNLCKK